jgi:hypothetical protein
MEFEINKFKRSDGNFITKLLADAFNARIGVLAITLVCLGQMYIIYVLLNVEKKYLVVDINTGQTFQTKAATNKTSYEIIDRQLIYYSTQVCEDFFNYDYTSIQQARRRFLDIASKELAELLGDKWVQDSSFQRCIDTKTRSVIEWEYGIDVTERNDPYYSIYAEFTRILKIQNVTTDVRKFRVKLDWGRLRNNTDSQKRPHALILTGISVLKKNSPEYKEQIRKLQKKG